ncbi:MAG: 16S rRNA (cytosine(1402)-N(4))-methyltransferase RsmH [Bacteroidales bacterium]|nr:16S rRNA (cytosine(1402)-N(4))-methyltransferase RsmH [Bacteroidales bacterium]MBR3609640.1 16S rRNA (cytosine(1402)-N(4))-methyltransferase RsmH [Bacteroidales bacterium]
MQEPVYHIPALLNECIDGLNISPNGTYIDVTFGGGGHSRGIIERLGTNGKLFSFDQDSDAEKNIIDDKRFTFVKSNFRFLKNFMKYHNIEQVDGIIADLGVSFHHFDEAERGFSFRFDGKLDMRMNRRGGNSAAEVINKYPESKIADILYYYGEMRNARKIAAEIVKKRESKVIETTSDLLSIIKGMINPKQEKKELAQIFQALRIEVNDEMTSLKSMLQQSVEMLKPGGRIVVLTYHSLEDRIVKDFFRYGNFDGKAEQDFFGRLIAPLKQINNKVITPSEEEIERNPRSRSAKLRIAEKI